MLTDAQCRNATRGIEVAQAHGLEAVGPIIVSQSVLHHQFCAAMLAHRIQ